MTTFAAIEVVRLLDGQVEHTISFDPPKDERSAGRVDDGLNRNLDHERFFTRLVEETPR